jgi:hypothetical protein
MIQSSLGRAVGSILRINSFFVQHDKMKMVLCDTAPERNFKDAGQEESRKNSVPFLTPMRLPDTSS